MPKPLDVELLSKHFSMRIDKATHKDFFKLPQKERKRVTYALRDELGDLVKSATHRPASSAA